MHDSHLTQIDQRQKSPLFYRYHCILAYLGLLLVFPVQAAQPHLTITQAVWTADIGQDKMPQQIYTKQAPLAPLYLWTHIQAAEEVLQVLRENGKLPIRHQWFRSRFGHLYFDQTQQPLDNIDLTLGTSEKLQKLQTEMQQRGFFDWRTWSGKRNMQRGYWRVRVVYADNTPVLCGNAPCVYDIEVK